MTTGNKPTFPILSTVVAFLAIVIMLGLGFWQLERKQEKEQRISHIESAEAADKLILSEVKGNITAFQDYSMSAEGKLVHKLFYIDNKLIEGKAGFHVLSPFLTNDGILILNHGWVPAAGLRVNLPIIQLSDTNVVTGTIYLPTKNPMIRETNQRYQEFPVRLQQNDLAEIEKHLGEPVLPFILRLSPDDGGFVREWQVITMPPEKHLAYALQWFGLAIAALTIYLLSALKWMHGPKPT